MTITEMRNKRKKLIETMDGFLDTHKTKNGTLSAEDDATYKTMEDEITELTNDVLFLQTINQSAVIFFGYEIATICVYPFL